MDGGDLAIEYNRTYITGGYGFSIRELDDGRSIVVFVQPGGLAELAGMQVGAELISIDDVPIAEAIGQTAPFSPQSTDFGLRYEQTIFVLRGEVGTQKEFAFANPGEASQSVTLMSEWEMDSLFATYLGGEFDENVLPVEYRILPSWIGYIRMNSNSDDLNLAYRIFERALETFEENEVVGLILDLRLNFGGSPLSVAGWLSEEEITLGQLEYYSDLTGKFEPEGNPNYIAPYTHVFDFDKMVLLVDQFCFSACEIEAYGLSQVDGMVVMGQFPTGGVEAETARGDFELPEGISLTVPTGRFTLPDGSIFLEGVGVVPTIDIPVDEESVLSEEDVVLQAAEDYILE
jgi:C-terminal processing protease CtpA/Prc